MAIELATAYVSLVPTAKGITAGIARELGDPLTEAGRRSGEDTSKSFGKSFQSGLKSAAKAGALAFGGLLAGGIVFAKDALSAASDLNESVNAVSVTYGDAAKGVLDLGKNSAKSFGLSKDEFNGLAVRFSNFAQTVAGKGGDVVGTLGDLTGRATDFASVMNLDVSDAAELFQSGLAGETEPLRKYGIDLSAAAVNAYAMANGIGTAGTELTEAQKVQARYGLLMASTSKAQGDFANTSDGLANQQRILKASFEDSKAAIGTALMPAIAAIMPVIQQAAEWLGEHLPAAVEAVRAWFEKNWPKIQASVIPVIEKIRDGIVGFVTFISDIWAKWGDDILLVINTVWPPIQTIIEGTINQIRGVIKVVTDLIRGDWSGAWDGIKQIVQGVWDQIRGIIELSLAVIRLVIQAGWDLIKGVVLGSVDAIVGFVTAIPGRIVGVVSTMWDGIKTGITAAKDWVLGAVNGIVTIAAGLPGRMAGLFVGMWDGIKNAFKSAINAVIGWWNGLDFSFPGYDIPGPGPNIPGFTIGLPDIPPIRHSGGVVPGVGEVPVLALGGELVLTRAQQAQLFAMASGQLDPASRGGLVIEHVDVHNDVDADGFFRYANFAMAAM